MKEQLMSWAQNPTFENKWDRLAFSKRGTFVIAWVWTEDDKFNANVMNLHGEGDAVLSQKGFASLEDAKTFADGELKKQGYKVV